MLSRVTPPTRKIAPRVMGPRKQSNPCVLRHHDDTHSASQLLTSITQINEVYFDNAKVCKVVSKLPHESVRRQGMHESEDAALQQRVRRVL